MPHTASNSETVEDEESDDLDEPVVRPKKKRKLTFKQLKECGYKGTRYDAEIVRDQRFYNSQTTAGVKVKIEVPDSVIEDVPGPTPRAVPPPTPPPILTAAAKKSYEDLAMTLPGTIRVHQRSLRSTPDRIRKRCQLGRAASDSSSGISDDGASSTHSSSSSDSGIETSSLDGANSVLLERGVREMRLDQDLPREPRHQQQQGVKLTLRMKRTTSLSDETAEAIGAAHGSHPDQKKDEYEVLRVEGVDSLWRKRSNSSKKNRKRETSTSSTGSASGLTAKRLKLRLGDETMTTIDLDQID